MKKVFFTVGPSQVYPTLYKHIQEAIRRDIPSLSHRGSEFRELYKSVDLGLRELLGVPPTHQIFFVSSALEGMESSIQGVVEKKSFHVLTGSFGSSWTKIASQLGKKVESVDLKSVICHPERLVEGSLHLGRDDNVVANLKLPKNTELICITQNDTSTGISIPMEEIYNLKMHNPKKLIAIDVVSSIPYVSIDFSKIDITFFSVQKGFGLPAGLGVMIVSDQALQKCSQLVGKGFSVGSYHSLLNLSEKSKDFQTPETPNVLNIYLLAKVISDMKKVGIERIRAQTEEKARILYDKFEKSENFTPFVKLEKYRSKTTLVIDTKGKTKEIKNRLLRLGFEVGSGYGENKETHIRIANFPSHSLKQVKDMVKVM